MATTQEKWQEIANRGLQDNFDPQTRAKFDEAVKRGLIVMPQQAQQPQQAEPTLEDKSQLAESLFGFNPLEVARKVKGIGETAGFLGASTVARPVSGIEGLVTTALDGSEAGAEEIKKQQALLTPELSQEGQDVLQSIGGGLESIMKLPGIDKIIELSKDAGDFVTKVGEITGQSLGGEQGEMIGGAIGKATPQALIEGALLKSTIPGKAAARQFARAPRTAQEIASINVNDIADGVFKFQSPTKQKIANLINEGSTDASTATFKLSGETIAPQTSKIQKALNIGGPRVVNDAVAIETIKQGFDESVIAAVKGSSQADKVKMLKMVKLMERSKENAREAIFNRPSGVAGDSLLERFKYVNQTNKEAGKELDTVAKSLKGQNVDHTGAINSYIGNLDDMGIKVNNDFSLDFRGSMIEGGSPEALKAQSILNTTTRRLLNTKTPDAFDVHRMKKFIDSQVTFGKSAVGLPGGSERILKSLRRNLDDSLDQAFPQYDKVNKVFAETRTAIDNLQDVAGKKMNLTGKNADEATGTLLRRLMSNAQSRVPLLDSVKELETVAVRNGGKFDDDLITQVLFADELDAVFKPVARTSFQGQIKQAVSDVPVTVAGLAVKGIEKTVEKVRNINEDAAFKAINKLLKEGQ